MVSMIRKNKKRNRWRDSHRLRRVDEENHEPIASNSHESYLTPNKKESRDTMIKVIKPTVADQESPGSTLDNDDSESIHCPITLESNRCRELDTSKSSLLAKLAIAKKSEMANRFTDAQRGRTLCHHKLIQPTPSQERAHISKLRRYEPARAFSSQMSLQSLPEEVSDQEEAVVQLDLKHMQSCDTDAVTAPRKNSSSDTCSTKMSSSVSDCSTSRFSIEGDSLSEASPMTTLFVPGRGCDPEDDVENTAIPEPNDSAEFSLSMFSCCQPCEMYTHSPSHRFVVCADTQFGIATDNDNWQAEMEYSIDAVNAINKMDPQPSFVCVCGDLVDMEFSFEKKKGSKSKFPSTLFNGESGIASREVCDFIQDEQNADFKRIWSGLDPSIALVCLCGNHDIGNRPTPRSISRFRSAFGDEYLAFWSNGSYNIVLNNVIYQDPTGAERIFKTQHRWLENRLQYARDHQATNIFVFSHHPWFLYDEFEDPEELTGYSPYPVEWRSLNYEGSFPDSYFSMPKKYRAMALILFRQYGVTACFSGHFHQNLASKTSWGMDMIITSSLSVVFDSTGKKNTKGKENLDGEELNILRYQQRRRRKMTYESEEAMMSDSVSDDDVLVEPNCRGVRVVDVQSDSGFRHLFVPLK